MLAQHRKAGAMRSRTPHASPTAVRRRADRQRGHRDVARRSAAWSAGARLARQSAGQDVASSSAEPGRAERGSSMTTQSVTTAMPAISSSSARNPLGLDERPEQPDGERAHAERDREPHAGHARAHPVVDVADDHRVGERDRAEHDDHEREHQRIERPAVAHSRRAGTAAPAARRCRRRASCSGTRSSSSPTATCANAPAT